MCVTVIVIAINSIVYVFLQRTQYRQNVLHADVIITQTRNCHT